MTTARSSWRSSLALAAILAGAGTRASAHRLDEYLQATRILVEPARLQITLDLTAGVSVAAAILGDLDRDRDGSLGADETRACLDVSGDIQRTIAVAQGIEHQCAAVVELDGEPIPALRFHTERAAAPFAVEPCEAVDGE